MRCLLIDNYDSFTWNLADQIGRAFGEAPRVLRNDACAWDALDADRRYDCIVISPGPGSVEREADFRIARQAIARSGRPLLGVCLGFQGIAHGNGGRIAHAPEPYHGRVSRLRHDGSELFAGLPASFEVVRYHSLIVAAPLPPALQATAHSDDGLIMALRHRERPQWGVQFHPESILSEYGIDLIANFRDQVWRDQARRGRGRGLAAESSAPMRAPAEPPVESSADPSAPPRRLRLWRRPLPAGLDAEAVFCALYASQRNSFWLDSQDAGEDRADRAAYSFMGAVEDADLLAYRIADDDAELSAGQGLLARMERELGSVEIVEAGDEATPLPFDFRGGYIGWLGYEAQALFDGERGRGSSMPDASWMRVRSPSPTRRPLRTPIPVTIPVRIRSRPRRRNAGSTRPSRRPRPRSRRRADPGRRRRARPRRRCERSRSTWTWATTTTWTRSASAAARSSTASPTRSA